ncbi:MAG: OmpP1/FadL family transporter [bacterium]
MNRKGKIIVTTILIGWISISLLLLTASRLYAQVEPFSVSSPPTPVGSGARAMGIGGAFVAVADDATAASWNPAGLIQLQTPEVSAVYSVERRVERRYSIFFPDIDGEEKTNISDLNYLSMAYPFNLARRNMVLSLNYQRLFDFRRDLRVNWSDGSADEFHSRGTLYTLSPALAIQAREDLFLGATINIWSDDWTGRSDWKNTYQHLDPNWTQGVVEEYKNFRGVNANFGLLYRVNPKLTLGLVFKTPFRGKFDYSYRNSADPNINAGVAYGKIESIDLPPTYALGISYRMSDAWTLSFDVTRKDWDELVWRNGRGESFGLFTAFDPNGVPVVSPRIDPTYALRFGMEYLKILEKTVIPIRGGIFYDPIPSIGSPHNEYGFSFGSGLSLGNLIVDFAYQYRVRYDVPGTERGLGYGAFEDKRQHILLFSTIYHF